MTSIKNLLKGEKMGDYFVGGKPEESSLLDPNPFPEKDDDHYAPSGKPQWTEGEKSPFCVYSGINLNLEPGPCSCHFLRRWIASNCKGIFWFTIFWNRHLISLRQIPKMIQELTPHIGQLFLFSQGFTCVGVVFFSAANFSPLLSSNLWKWVNK